MKRLLIAVVAACLAGSAAASSIDFAFGTNFYTPAVAGEQTENGTNFSVGWNLDSDITLAAYTEAGRTQTATVGIAAIQVTKAVVKQVKVGLNLGSMTTVESPLLGATIQTDTEPLIDIFGQVTILSGSGDNISGQLVAFAAARFSRADVSPDTDVIANGVQEADGSNIGLAVLIGF